MGYCRHIRKITIAGTTQPRTPVRACGEEGGTAVVSSWQGVCLALPRPRRLGREEEGKALGVRERPDLDRCGVYLRRLNETYEAYISALQAEPLTMGCDGARCAGGGIEATSGTARRLV